MLERDFQAQLIQDLKRLFPGCIVSKMDPNYIQGFPDLLILYRKNWAVLECKKDEKAYRKSVVHYPNQPYYVSLLDNMSFARFIYPENKEEVLYELQQAFGV